MSSTLAQNKVREQQRQIQAQHQPSGKASAKPSTAVETMATNTISTLTNELVSAVSAGWGLAGMGPSNAGTFAGGATPLVLVADVPLPSGATIDIATTSSAAPFSNATLVYDDYEFIDMPPYQPTSNVSVFTNIPPSTQAVPPFVSNEGIFGTGAWGFTYGPDAYIPPVSVSSHSIK